MFKEEGSQGKAAKFVCTFCKKQMIAPAIEDINISDLLDEIKNISFLIWGKNTIDIQIKSDGDLIEIDKTYFQREHISERVRREVWRRDQGKCVECGSNKKLEFDHIIPVSKGGSNTARNLRLLCETCNRKKSNKV